MKADYFTLGTEGRTTQKNLMAGRKKCFISYAQVDEDFVNEFIIPALIESEVEVLSQNTPDFNSSFNKDIIVDLILKSDFIVCLLNKRSTYVNLELGTAIGNNKPVLALISDNSTNEDELGFINYIKYSRNKPNELSISLRQAIQIVNDNVINRGANAIYGASDAYNDEYLIGIRIGTETSDYERELEFTLEFVRILKTWTENGKVSLVQTSKGSLISILTGLFKPSTDLIEKVAFYPVEYEKKQAEADKTRAEAEKSRAEADKTHADADKSKAEAGKTDAEAAKIRVETKALEANIAIQRYEMLLDLMRKQKDLGATVQFGDQLLITTNPDGSIEIKVPKQLE